MHSAAPSPVKHFEAQSPSANIEKNLPQSAHQAMRVFRYLENTKDGLLDPAKPLALIFSDEEESTDEEDICSVESSPTSTLRKQFTDLDFEIEKNKKKTSIEDNIAQQNSQLLFTCITITDFTLLAITEIQESNDKEKDEQLTLLCQQASALINFAAHITPTNNPFSCFQSAHASTNDRETWLRQSMENIANTFPSLMISEFFVSEVTALADAYQARYVSNKDASFANTKAIPACVEHGLEQKAILVNLRERLDELSQPLQHLAPIATQELREEVRLEIKTDITNSRSVLVPKKTGSSWQISSTRTHTFWQGNPSLKFRDLKRKHSENSSDTVETERNKTMRNH